MNKPLAWGLGLLVLLGIAWYLVSSNTASQTAGEVKIGGLFALSGYAAFVGEASHNGFILALEDAGLNPDDYPFEDFHSDTKTAVSAAKKLAEVDGARVVLGPEWGEFSEAIVPVATADKAVFISPWSQGEGQSFVSPFYFSMTPSERSEVKEVLSYMASHNISTIALVYSNNAWSVGLSTIIKDEIAHSYPSIKIVFESQQPQDSVDYRTDLVKIKSADAQAVYALMATGQTGGSFVGQYRQLGLKMPLFFPYSNYSAIKTASATADLEGALYPAAKAYDRTPEFNQKYTARFGSEPAAISAATTYDSTTLALMAIKHGATTGEEIAEYLKTVKGFKGYSGVITFDATNHVVPQPVEIRQVVGDSYKVVQ